MAALEWFRAPSFPGWAGIVAVPARSAVPVPRMEANLPSFEAFVLSQVLLVDDNPVQLQVREAILRGAGFRVSIATSADIALALLRTASQHFGLVITDHLMPGTSGVEFVKRLRESGEAVSVVVLSGLPDAEMEYEGLDVAFRLKPLPPTELIELVRRSIRSAA